MAVTFFHLVTSVLYPAGHKFCRCIYCHSNPNFWNVGIILPLKSTALLLISLYNNNVILHNKITLKSNVHTMWKWNSSNQIYCHIQSVFYREKTIFYLIHFWLRCFLMQWILIKKFFRKIQQKNTPTNVYHTHLGVQA